jgi:hypothetical protein
MRLDGTPLTVFNGNMATAGLTWQHALLTPSAAGWTPTEVNALKARVGYSTDVAPLPDWDAVMVEADYPQ